MTENKAPYTLPCEPACSSPTYCPHPALDCDRSEWQAFWAKHPSRAKYSRPLSYYERSYPPDEAKR